jgi:hypothetical protein
MAVDRSEFQVHIRSTGETGGVREMREQFHFLKLAIGDSLGPIGELIHFLSNPYLLAAAGAAMAIKMLVEQHEKLIENVKKNISLSQEMKDSFENVLRTAVNNATEAVANFHRTLSAVGSEEDHVAKEMASQISIIDARTEATKSLAAANRALQEVLIHAREDAGQISSPEAARELEIVRQQERRAQEEADHRKAAAEIQTKITAAAEHERQSAAAAAAADAARPESVRASQAVELAKAEKLRREGVLNALKEEEAAAQAKAQAAGGRPSDEEYAGRWNSTLNMAADIAHRKELYDKLDAIRKEESTAKGAVQAEEDTITRDSIQQKNIDAAIERNEKLAESHLAAAQAMREEALAQTALTAAHEQGQAQIDAMQDATERAKRIAELRRHQDAGTLTRDEQNEAGGIQYRGNFAEAARDMEARFREVQTNLRLGTSGSDDQRRILDMLDWIIGFHEGGHIPPNLESRIHTLEDRLRSMANSYNVNRTSP